MPENCIQPHQLRRLISSRLRAVWKVYWMRADLKWYSYSPVPTGGNIEKFLELVENDKHACLFG